MRTAKILAVATVILLLVAPKAYAGDDALWAIGGFIVGNMVNEHSHHHRNHHRNRHYDPYYEETEYIRICVSRDPWNAGCRYERRTRRHVESYYYDCTWYEDYPPEIRHRRWHQRHEDPNCAWMP